MRRTVIKTLGLVALAAAAVVYLINPTLAADKGGPPVKVDAQGNERPLFSGCYGQAGVHGLFADSSDTLKAFAVGAGCDWQVGAIVLGANARFAFGQYDTRALYVGGRIGYSLNPHTLAYVPISLMMDGRAPDLNDSVIMGGIGLETYLNKQLTIFMEATTDLGKWGDAGTLPQIYEIHGGLRIRF